MNRRGSLSPPSPQVAPARAYGSSTYATDGPQMRSGCPSAIFSTGLFGIWNFSVKPLMAVTKLIVPSPLSIGPCDFSVVDADEMIDLPSGGGCEDPSEVDVVDDVSARVLHVALDDRVNRGPLDLAAPDVVTVGRRNENRLACERR